MMCVLLVPMKFFVATYVNMQKTVYRPMEHPGSGGIVCLSVVSSSFIMYFCTISYANMSNNPLRLHIIIISSPYTP